MGQQAGPYYVACCDTHGNSDCDQLVFLMFQVGLCTFAEGSRKVSLSN